MSDLGHLHYDNVYTASFPGFHTDNQVHHSEDMKTDKEHRVAEDSDNMNKADIFEAAGAAGVDRTEVVDRIEADKAGAAAADKAVAAEADRVEAAADKEGIASHSYHNNTLQEPGEAGIRM